MITIKLDQAGDIDLATGTIALIEGADALAQRLRARFRFFLGEWFLDRRQGIPYYQRILGQKMRKSLVDATMREVLLTTPGVAAVDNVSVAWDGAQRRLSVDWTVHSATGDVVSGNDAFIV